MARKINISKKIKVDTIIRKIRKQSAEVGAQSSPACSSPRTAGYHECPKCLAMIASLGFKLGVVSSGNSLDFTDKCMEIMTTNKVTMGVRSRVGCRNEVRLAGSFPGPAALHIVVGKKKALDNSGPQVAVKEMEAGAIQWVCNFFSKPLLCIKSVTDIVDGGRCESKLGD